MLGTGKKDVARTAGNRTGVIETETNRNGEMERNGEKGNR